MAIMVTLLLTISLSAQGVHDHRLGYLVTHPPDLPQLAVGIPLFAKVCLSEILNKNVLFNLNLCFIGN